MVSNKIVYVFILVNEKCFSYLLTKTWYKLDRYFKLANENWRYENEIEIVVPTGASYA